MKYLIFPMNMLLAISTTIGMTLIPILCTETLGWSLIAFALLEGLTEFASNFLRVVNGIIFDKINNKKRVIVFSNLLAFISKLFLIFPTPLMIVGSKTLERIANGSFATPRDAYVTNTFKEGSGRILGWLASFKSIGCVLGPCLVSFAFWWISDHNQALHFSLIFCLTATTLSFIMSFFLSPVITVTYSEEIFSWKELKEIFFKVRKVCAYSFIFFLCRFNDGVLMLQLKKLGYPSWFYLSTVAIFNSIMFASSPYIGKKSTKDNIDIMENIVFGFMFCFSLCFIFLKSWGWTGAILGLLFWGLQRTGAQIVFVTHIKQCVPKRQIGTAIGIFYIISGFGSLIASFLAGLSYEVWFVVCAIIPICFVTMSGVKGKLNVRNY